MICIDIRIKVGNVMIGGNNNDPVFYIYIMYAQNY